MLLEVKKLDAGYGAVPVLRGIDMHVEDGEVIAVLGSNGAGKSTLVNDIDWVEQKKKRLELEQ